MSTTPTPQSDQAATTPGRAEELARSLDSYKRAPDCLKEAAALIRAQSATIDRLNQLVSERTEAANDFEQKAIALNAELLSIRHELNAANDWAKSQGLLLTQANAELLALRDRHESLQYLVTTDHESKAAFIQRVRAALNSPTQKQPVK